METRDYRRALATAVAEYEGLLRERQRLDTRLAQLAQTIASLRRLCGLAPVPSGGLTESVRALLQAEGRPLSPLEVRDGLAAMGFDLGRYASDLAAIHTVLKRLAESGRAGVATRPGGGSAYQWREPVRAIAITKDELRALVERGVTISPPERRRR